MPDVLPAGIETDKGVKFNGPSLDRIVPIRNAVEKAFADLPPGANNSLMIVANETGANAVIAVNFTGKVEIISYIGKKWEGSLEYGAVARIRW